MTYLTSRLCSAVWKIKVISRLISGSIDLWTTELCLMSTINHMWCSLCFCGFSCMMFRFFFMNILNQLVLRIYQMCVFSYGGSNFQIMRTQMSYIHTWLTTIFWITSRNKLCVFNGLIHKSIWIFKISVSDYQHGI